jgi:glycerophosphoryl diester phosphodiesterase
VSVNNYLSDNPFYGAHRGSGGEYPEMTMVAYDSIVAAGAKAIEVSVQISADGVLFCMHDTTLDRMTNSTWTGSSATWTYAALNQRAKIVGFPLLGPGWANQDIPTLRQVLDKYMGKVVIFVEAKTSPGIVPLQNLLLTYQGANQSVIWKNYYLNTSFPWAKAHGFTTWGYVDVGTTNTQMDAVDANIDFWGVPIEAPDSQFTSTLARPGGKKVMSWEVHRRSEVTRLHNLGVQGIMASQWEYLNRTTPVITTDQFLQQVKSPGEIGAAHSDPTFAMKWDTVVGTNVVNCPKTGGAAINLGSFCPVIAGGTGYQIKFDMYWPQLPLSPTTLHAGFYFGQVDDSKHTFGVANTQGCYRMEIRPGTGAMQLYTVAPGATSGVQVGSDVTTSGALVQATWYSYRIDVTATTVTLNRTDSTGWSQAFSDTTYRGLYFGFHNGSLTDANTLPRFRNISVVAI